MKWKEFFKLDKQHVILFIVLVVLSIIFSSNSFYYAGDVQYLTGGGIFLILSLLSGMYIGTFFNHNFVITYYTIIIFLFSVLYTYTLSSLILLIYYKIKKGSFS